MRSIGTVVVALLLLAGPAAAQSAPTGWTTKDIGAVQVAGSASSLNGTMTVTGAGADIWGTNDSFRYLYRPLTGDGSIVTRVTAIDYVHAWTKAGVMVRETLAPNAAHASLVATPGKGLAFQRRAKTGGASVSTGAAGSAPRWLRLTRTGQTITAAVSVDGNTWTTIGTQALTLPETVYVGLAVSSHVATATASASFSDTVTATAVSSAAAAGPSTLKVLHWNVHHGGVGTDGKLDANRIASWIAKMDPDIASLNEVDTTAQMNAILNALKTQTGTTWSASFSGKGNIVIAKHAQVSASKCVYPDGKRYAAHLGIEINGRPINVWSTHLTVNNAAMRKAEAESLQACATNWSEARILAGDYNAQPGSPEYKAAVVGYTDAWAAAKAAGTAVNYPGNCDGCTRNSRIDYVFTSQTASFLVLKSAQMVDTRDAKGVLPSDHKPLLVTYEVR